MQDDDLFEVFQTSGQALGFVLGLALADPDALKTKAGMEAFADQLLDLTDQERFSPNVTFVVTGIADGLKRRNRATPDDDVFI